MNRINIFLIIILPFFKSCAYSQIQGVWHSNFQVAGKSLLMDLDVKGIGQDGSIIISIPDQPKMKPQTMTEFALFSDSLWFSWKAIGLTYAANLQGDSLIGKMSQGGITWKAVFYKEVQQIKEVQGKIQDPKAPFPIKKRNYPFLLLKRSKFQEISSCLKPKKTEVFRWLLWYLAQVPRTAIVKF